MRFEGITRSGVVLVKKKTAAGDDTETDPDDIVADLTSGVFSDPTGPILTRRNAEQQRSELRKP